MIEIFAFAFFTNIKDLPQDVQDRAWSRLAKLGLYNCDCEDVKTQVNKAITEIYIPVQVVK